MTSQKATLIGLVAIVLWSTMVGLIRGVSEGLGPVGGAAIIYSLSGLLLIFTVGLPDIRRFPGRYLIAGSVLFVSYEICLALSLGYAATRHQAIEVGMVNYLRMMAMRHYMRSQTVEGVTDTRAIDEVGLSVQQVEEMYRYLAIANYEDRFVIPTSHREMARDAFPERNGCGFTFGDGCHGSDTKFNLFNSSRIDAINITEVRDKAEGE